MFASSTSDKSEIGTSFGLGLVTAGSVGTRSDVAGSLGFKGSSRTSDTLGRSVERSIDEEVGKEMSEIIGSTDFAGI